MPNVTSWTLVSLPCLVIPPPSYAHLRVRVVLSRTFIPLLIWKSRSNLLLLVPIFSPKGSVSVEERPVLNLKSYDFQNYGYDVIRKTRFPPKF